MGIYIDPKKVTAKEWLEWHGVKMSSEHKVDWESDDEVLVCLVRNPAFYAAAVVYSRDEFERFTRPDDVRPKEWWLVGLKDLADVVPAGDYQFLTKLRMERREA